MQTPIRSCRLRFTFHMQISSPPCPPPHPRSRKNFRNFHIVRGRVLPPIPVVISDYGDVIYFNLSPIVSRMLACCSLGDAFRKSTGREQKLSRHFLRAKFLDRTERIWMCVCVCVSVRRLSLPITREMKRAALFRCKSIKKIIVFYYDPIPALTHGITPRRASPVLVC